MSWLEDPQLSAWAPSLEDLEAEAEDPVATFGDREPGPEPDPTLYGTIRCPCGRLRQTFRGEVRGACAHGAGR